MTDLLPDNDFRLFSSPVAAEPGRCAAPRVAWLTAAVIGLLMAGCEPSVVSSVGSSARSPAPTPLAVAPAPAPRTLESTLRLDPDAEEISFYPEIAHSRYGDSVAVWEQFDGSRYQIWGNHRRGGSGWGRATLIKRSDTGHGYSPRVSINRLGHATAIWVQADDAAHTYRIWSSGFEPVAGWSAPVPVSADSQSPAYAPQVALGDSGSAAAVWQQSDGRRFNIWSSRSPAGGPWSPAVKLQASQVPLGAPSVTMDAQGNATAVWPQAQGSRSELWTRRAAPGQPWGKAVKIQSLQGDAHRPQIVAGAQGDVTLREAQLQARGHRPWTVTSFTGSTNSTGSTNFTSLVSFNSHDRASWGRTGASRPCPATSSGLQARQNQRESCDGSGP